MNPSTSNVGKSVPAPSNSAAVQAGPATSNFESFRRPSQAGSSYSQSMPRKVQGSRKQHRSQRRPGLGDRSNTGPDDEDAMDELRAFRNPNSRRGQTSITHLLNYSISRPVQDHHSHSRSYRRTPTWGPGSGYHASDKARYVHANYRFILSPEGTYNKQATDADTHLDWSLVMQIIASSESQGSSCPICLSEPVAPRMAKCGHIFCLPCLIRFMNSVSSEDEAKGRGPRWKKCPICEDSIYMQDVRPVRFYAGQESPFPRTGDDVVLRLMARNASSTMALPRESGSEALYSVDDIPWHFAANVLDYARMMKGTTDYMAAQYDEEIAALAQQAKEDETLFGQNDEWSQKAIRAITTAKEKLAELEVVESSATSAKLSADADFYFYSSPPHLYLSPLDIRILKTKYGSFSSFPSTLLPRVEHISTGHVVDDAMRRRAKYLGHLPRGCVVNFLECDWTDIVPEETLASFSVDIERRRRRNRDKETQEERERLQAERLEAANIRKTTGYQRLSEPSEEDNAPRMDLEEFLPLSGHSGSTPPDPRPGFETLAEMSTSPSNQKTVWGTRVINGSPEMAAVQPLDVHDGWLRDEDLFDTADIAMQIQAIEAAESSVRPDSVGGAGPSSSGGGNGGGGKKKKKQKITLMSTGGRRGN
ncbi:ring-15 protein [Fusarium sporotrichioides]|uniref:Ring-15 protein n=1 Tax=Fusarium sporotrichioides TaxID=5514 RepID=A0A395RH76_FUSSP|nr:ring-15 protein [Fusarium sporotrichioides]